MKKVIAIFLAGFFMVGCTALTAARGADKTAAESASVPASAAESFPVKETESAAEPLKIEGASIEALGYRLELPADAGLENPNGDGPWTQFYSIETCNDNIVYTAGAKQMHGEYTLVAALAPEFMTVSYLGIAYLQGFRKSDLAAENAVIAVGDKTYRPDELKERLLFEDDETVVYDFVSLAESDPFETRLEAHRTNLRESLGDPAGIAERKAVGRYNKTNEERIMNWDFSFTSGINKAVSATMKLVKA